MNTTPASRKSLRGHRLPVLAALISGSILAAPAPEWPQFRGPQASGVNTNQPAPTHWNVESGDNIRWQTDIPGLAHSSPIIAGDRIYLTTAVKPGRSELKVGLYGEPIGPMVDG